VDLSAEETALYESLRRAALEKLARSKDRPRRNHPDPGRDHEAAPRLLQSEPGGAGTGLASSKLAAFSRLLLGLLDNRHKVLVFSQFVDHLSLIREHLDQQASAYQYLDGATPMAERKKRVDAFQAGRAMCS
jgi:SNF2 family DNA or RNA helicase